MWGSNFPPSSAAASYQASLAGLLDSISARPAQDRRRLMHDTAQMVFRKW
jgi:predicted TIM-barrel fold metal-dependent hydrolase